MRILLLCLLLLCSKTYAVKSDDLFNMCTSDDYTLKWTCTSHLEASKDMIIFFHVTQNEQLREFCLPEGLTTSIVEKIWAKFIAEEPQFLVLSATATVYHSLKQAYPCVD